MYTITVSTLSDSGTGSLREAILDANAYTGEDEIQIIFDAALAGQELSLSSALPTLSKACTISAPVVFNNLTCSKIVLTGEATISAEALVLTAATAITLQNWGGSLNVDGITTTATNAQVSISSNIYTCELQDISATFPGGYSLNGTVVAGHTVTLASGGAGRRVWNIVHRWHF